MRLSIDILADELKDCLRAAYIPEDSSLDLDGVRFLASPSGPLYPNLLYVGSQLPDVCPESFHMLYLGTLSPDEVPEHSSILVLDEACGEQILFNRVLDIFHRYTLWETTLKNLLAEHAPLSAFLDVSQPILKSGIVLLDWDHNCIAVTRIKMENSPLWNAILDGYGYKYKFVIEHSNPKLADITRMNKLQQNWSNLDNRYLYNVPLYINGFPMFGLGLHKIEEPTVPFGKHITQLFEVLIDIITRRLTYENQVHPTRGLLYDAFVRDLINGSVQKPDELNQRNNYIPLAEEDQLALGVVVFKNVNYRSSFLSNCARELEALWPGSVCSVIDCQLLWIINLKDQVDFSFVPAALRTRIDQWMAEKVARCGISPPFHSLSLVQQRYRQAISALHYGLACGGENHQYVYGYFDRLDYQLLDLASSSVDLTTLIHPILRFLMAFDQDHKTDYYETLKEYLLNEYSLTFNEIAAKLHVHRNTLHYRLDKIQEITALDFKDAVLKQQLLLSIYCFDLFPKCSYDG